MAATSQSSIIICIFAAKMKARFIQYLSELADSYEKKKFLLAVSGGKDSCVMAHLFFSAGPSFDIAHCNFNLRGNDSIRDKNFVMELAHNYNVTCYTKDFDTLKKQKNSGESIEMVARKLRYDWFDKIGKKYDYIVTAHHANDNAETVLLNMVRGTGLKGMTGIPAKNGKIIRPLLLFTADEITDYAINNHLDYCEDYTNKENNYQRNKIRNLVLPQLKEINSQIIHTLNKNIHIWKKQYHFYQSQIQEKIQQHLHQEKNYNYININDLNNEPFKDLILYELLSPIGFSESDIQNIIEALTHQSGKKFYSPTHTVVKEREKLIIAKLEIDESIYKTYNSIEELAQDNFQIELISIKQHSHFDVNPNTAYFDADKIKFPIIVRNWQKGDYFYPFGMEGKMKLSDFFNNQKIDNYKKSKIKIMCSQKNIIWVVGYRSDNRYKVDTQKTKQYYKITHKNCE